MNGSQHYTCGRDDGKTLDEALGQIQKLTGITPKEAHVDQGYKGHGVTGTTVIASRQKRRNAIKPIAESRLLKIPMRGFFLGVTR